MVRFKAVQDELSDSDHEENSTPTHEAAVTFSISSAVLKDLDTFVLASYYYVKVQ